MNKLMNDEFTRRYSATRNLCFDLRPIGKTEEHIKKAHLLEDDELVQKKSKHAFEIIDRYYKSHIEKSLRVTQFDDLEEYLQLQKIKPKDLSKEKQKKRREQLNKINKKMADHLYSMLVFDKGNDKSLIEYSAKEMISHIVSDPENNLNDEEKEVLLFFAGKSGYLKKYIDSRRHIFSNELKAGTICNRLVKDNFKIFTQNAVNFSKIDSRDQAEIKTKLMNNFHDYLSDVNIDYFFSAVEYGIFITNENISRYNIVIGGYALEDGTKIKGVNELLNEYRQANKDKKPPKIKLKNLQKLMLTDEESESWSCDVLEDDDDLKEVLFESRNTLVDSVFAPESGESLSSLIKKLKTRSLNNIYIDAQSINAISKQLYGNWSSIRGWLRADYDKKSKAKDKTKDSYYQERERKLNQRSYYSIQEMNTLRKQYGDADANTVDILEYYSDVNDMIASCNEKWGFLVSSMQGIDPGTKIAGNKECKALIKEYMDSLKALTKKVKSLYTEDQIDADPSFYNRFDMLYTILCSTDILYNKVRNYLTKKPYRTDKIKMNFEAPGLLGGWDVLKEDKNLGVILRKDDMYYLGIIKKGSKGLFSEEVISEHRSGKCYEKMLVKVLANPKRDVIKNAFSKKGIEKCMPSQKVQKAYFREKGKEKKKYTVNEVHEIISYCQRYIKENENWEYFNIPDIDSESFSSIDDYFNSIHNRFYHMEFVDVSEEYINRLVENGDLYLFQVYCKDFSSYSKGKKNIQTLLWLQLFSKENLENPMIKLCGNAEVFFRPKSLVKTRPEHPKNQPIALKNPDYAAAVGRKEAKFTYDLTKDKRYTKDSYKFHVPVTLNFGASGSSESCTDVVRKLIRNDTDFNLIGIDRGERNLLYAVVINKHGQILEQRSLNLVENDIGGVQDYLRLLDTREKKRQENRQNWESVVDIRNLKTGYVSQAVHIITSLAIKHNALIVMEDLSTGFKNIRRRIEKSVYQQAETALIKKLNYYVDKTASALEPSGSMIGLQLTEAFTTVDAADKLKQNGIIFYVPADFTSAIDPTTGFAGVLYPKYKNVKESQDFFKKFDSFSYDREKDMYRFDVDYTKFGKDTNGDHTKWQVYTNGVRISRTKDKETGQWTYREVLLTEEMTTLLSNYGIDRTQGNMISSIVAIESKEFFQRLIWILKLTLQLRNSCPAGSIPGKGELDYITSPVINRDGVFFTTSPDNPEFPVDADANGAYNIALKGLILVERIKNTDSNNEIQYAIQRSDWFNFVQERARKVV